MSNVFNKLLSHEAQDPEFARAFAAETARIEVIDSILNALNSAREAEGLDKAALARSVGSSASSVRRLLSVETPNPTLGTIAELAAALGYRVTLEPLTTEDRDRLTAPMRACA